MGGGGKGGKGKSSLSISSGGFNPIRSSVPDSDQPICPGLLYKSLNTGHSADHEAEGWGGGGNIK